MFKLKNLATLSYVLIFIGILLFVGYMASGNVLLGVTALVVSYAAAFIYYYIFIINLQAKLNGLV